MLIVPINFHLISPVPPTFPPHSLSYLPVLLEAAAVNLSQLTYQRFQVLALTGLPSFWVAALLPRLAMWPLSSSSSPSPPPLALPEVHSLLLCVWFPDISHTCPLSLGTRCKHIEYSVELIWDNLRFFVRAACLLKPTPMLGP